MDVFFLKLERLQKAVREQKTAALLEKEKDDVFVTRLGNLDQGQTCHISLEYICEVRCH
jgi:hypothetical protein